MSTRDHNPWDTLNMSDFFNRQYLTSPAPCQNTISHSQIATVHKWFTSCSVEQDFSGNFATYELKTYRLPEILNILEASMTANADVTKQLEEIRKVIEAKEKRIDELMTIILENNIIMQDLLNQNSKLRDKLDKFTDENIEKLVEEKIKNRKPEKINWTEQDLLEKIKEHAEKHTSPSPMYPPYNPQPAGPYRMPDTFGPHPNIYPTIWCGGGGGSTTVSDGLVTITPPSSTKSYIVGHSDKMTELMSQYVAKDTQE